jgi:hypothetical protein
MRNARVEADKLAKIAGMKVDSVWAISSEPFPRIQDRMLTFNTFGTPAGIGGNVAENQAEVAPKYLIPPVKFNLYVHVIYLISPVK